MKLYGELTELKDLELRQSTGGQVLLNSSSTRTGGVQTLHLPDLGADTTSDTVAALAATQTLTNKTISGSSNTLTVLAGTQLSGQVPTANGGTGVNGTATFPGTGVVVTEAASETITNKTLIADGGTKNLFQSATGTARQLKLDLSAGTDSTATTLSVTQSANRTITFPDATGTVTLLDATQTLTNKTLTAPVIATIVNTGTLTLPTSTDTLVGRATTDTLTNKSISGSTNTITNVSLTAGVTGTLPIANGGTNGTTASAAFGNLSPLTTKGDLLGFSTVNARVPVGTDGQALVADSTQTLGVKYANVVTNPMTTAGDIIYGGASGTPTRLAAGTSVQVLHSGTTPSWSAISLTADVTGTLPVANGGTGQAALVTTPTASTIPAWDANQILSANNFNEGYSTHNAGGTTTITVASAKQQYFTGSSAQTLTLPVVSTLVLGQQWFVSNNSTAIVTVQSSGANTVLAMSAGTSATFTAILITGTTAASWQVSAVPGQLQGSASNDTANAGNVGEYLDNTRTSNLNITSAGTSTYQVADSGGTGGSATGITLTPGTWDICGSCQFSGNTAVGFKEIEAFPSTSTATSDSNGRDTQRSTAYMDYGTTGITLSTFVMLTLPVYRVNISSNTVYYLKFLVSSFTSGSVDVTGSLRATRIR